MTVEVIDDIAPYVSINVSATPNTPVLPVITIIENETGIKEQLITLNGEAYEIGTEIAENGTYTLVATVTDNADNTTTVSETFTINISYDQDEFLGTFESGPLAGVHFRDAATEDWERITNTPATQVARGDMDDDGIDDYIGVYEGNNAPGLWVKFADSGNWLRLSTSIPKWISAGDMNGDGVEDVVAAFSSGVYYRDAYSSCWTRIDSDSPSQIAIGDLDGDNRGDLKIIDRYQEFV